MPQHADCQEKGDVVLLSLSPGTELSCFFSVAIEAAHRTTKRDAVRSCTLLDSADLDEKGSGMGLAIARAIVHAHGGDIEVVSEPGAGACFRFWVPFVSEEPETARRQAT